MKYLSSLVVTLVLALHSVALADTCPPPPNSIDPAVSAKVSFDKKSGLYKYRYEVRNGADSLIPIASFMLQMTQAPTSTMGPPKWGGADLVTYMSPNHLIWGGIAPIPPGKGVSGFELQSKLPPGPTQYWADGDADVPSTSAPAEDATDDEPMPNCPDWNFNTPPFQSQVTGVTTGPLNPNTISVAIRLRDERSEHRFGPMNPNQPSGKVVVLVLATKSFDPSQIVASSLKFGPSGASPVSSKLVPVRDDDDRDEEREEWERHSRGLDDDHDHDHDKEPKRQNLLLTFDLASLGVQCVLDKAIFLNGQTQAGVNIIGAASTRLVGCDVHHPGKRVKKTDQKEFYSTFKKLHRIERAKGNSQ